MTWKRNSQREASYHFTLLAQNDTGYRNLVKLVSLAHLDGMYYKPRIDKDLLAKHSAEVELIEECIKRLKEMGYVNDDAFARNYANSRVRSKPVGRARLARELAMKKVAPTRISEALDAVFGEVAEETLIDQAIGRRIRTHGRPSDQAASKRMFDHLARLGFEYDLIIRKLRALKSGDRG